MIVGFDNIKNYLPQREPMMMVDTLISHIDNVTKSAFTIRKDNVLVENECLSEAGLLENMAQTAALGKGFESIENQEHPPLGFIGAVKRFTIIQLPQINDRIETKVEIKHQVMNATIAEAIIINNGMEIARCELKIFLNPKTV